LNHLTRLSSPNLSCDTVQVDDRLYEQLRRIAHSYMEREGPGRTIQPTALVHEAFIRLAERDGDDPAHFRAAASIAMRRVLVDEARRRRSLKRGGAGVRVTLMDGMVAVAPDLDLLALDEALVALSALSERRAKIVELRFFGGMTVPEVAEHLGIALRTVEADWHFARAWLRRRLEGSDPAGEDSRHAAE